jgi:hypothetical protein
MYIKFDCLEFQIYQMLRESKYGSVSLFWNGLLISMFEREAVEDYMKEGEYLIRETKGIPIKDQIITYKLYCEAIYKNKKNKKRITYEDHYLFRKCLFALMRLGIVENDENNGYFCMIKRKLPRKLRPEETQV